MSLDPAPLDVPAALPVVTGSAAAPETPEPPKAPDTVTIPLPQPTRAPERPEVVAVRNARPEVKAAYRKYLDEATTLLTEETHPELIRAYKAYCDRNQIEFIPEIRTFKNHDAQSFGAAVSLRSVASILLSPELLEFPLNEQLAILAHETGHIVATHLDRQDLHTEERSTDYFAARTLGEAESLAAALKRLQEQALPYETLVDDLRGKTPQLIQRRMAHGTPEDRILALRNLDLTNRQYEDAVITTYNALCREAVLESAQSAPAKPDAKVEEIKSLGTQVAPISAEAVRSV